MPFVTALLALLACVLSLMDRVAANPAPAGVLATNRVGALHEDGEWIPCPDDLPSRPEPVIERLDESALGEEEPDEGGGTGILCFALSGFIVPLVSDFLNFSIHGLSTRSSSVLSPFLRC
jgi:hypothetical protein